MPSAMSNGVSDPPPPTASDAKCPVQLGFRPTTANRKRCQVPCPMGFQTHHRQPQAMPSALSNWVSDPPPPTASDAKCHVQWGFRPTTANRKRCQVPCPIGFQTHHRQPQAMPSAMSNGVSDPPPPTASDAKC